MKKYRVDVYKDFWNCELIKRMYVMAESEADARSKGYDEYCKTLLFMPMAQPVLEANVVA